MASEKVTAIVEELKTLTVLELSELVSAVEEEFGVSAAAAVAVAAPAEGGAAAADEKTEFDVVLAEVPLKKQAQPFGCACFFTSRYFLAPYLSP